MNSVATTTVEDALMGRNGSIRRDDGFTVAEVVFSAAIFFFVFTSIMTMMTANLVTSRDAKQRSVMVNAVSSYIEQVRAMAYNEIGTPSGNPAGTLQSVTTTVGAYTVTIVPTVTWYDDVRLVGASDYKKLAMAVTCSTIGSVPKTITMASQVFISSAGARNNVLLTPPTIGFTSPATATPPPVVWGSQLLSVWAEAHGSGVALTTVYVECDGFPIVLSSGAKGQFAVNGVNFSQSLYWETQAVDATSGARIVPDGIHTIKIEAWDTNSQQGFLPMQVYVDNDAPSPPTTITVSETSAGTGPTSTRVTWAACLDGITPATHYYLRQYMQGATALNSGNFSQWTLTPSSGQPYNLTDTTFSSSPLQPLSRYLYEVLAASPRDLTSPSRNERRITRPLLTGTQTVTRSSHGGNHDWTVSVPLTASSPTFPYSTLTYTLFRSLSPTMSAATQIGQPQSQPNWTDTATISGGSSFPASGAFYYRVTTAVKPSGYPSGSSNATETLLSNIVGPVGPDQCTNLAMPNGGW